MDPIVIIKKYFDEGSMAYKNLIRHSELVRDNAIFIAEKLNKTGKYNVDTQFSMEAAMIHDIGIVFCDAKNLGCFGDKPYILHGVLGRELMEKEGYPKHALVCERHVGMGFTVDEIEKQNLPLPKRDMLPVSIEEKIISFSDKFYTKIPELLEKKIPIEDVRVQIAKYGADNLKRFEEMERLFL